MKKKLFTRNYALLWAGMSVSQLGDGAGFIGLMWWVQTNTGSALLLGMMAMIRSVISVALSPFSGVVADKFSKKTIIVLMDAIRGLAYGTLAWLVYTNQLTAPLLLSLVALNAVCSVFFGPAISSTVPLIVDKSNLPRANSLQQITNNIVSIVGYTAGGVLVALLGIPMLLLVDALSFLLSAVSEMFIIIPTIAANQQARLGGFVQNIKDGISYVRENKVLMGIMKVAAVLNFVAAPIFILLPKFVQEHLGGTPTLYGYLLAGSMAGTLLASLLIAFTKFVERNLWTIVHGITIQAGLMILFVAVPGDWHILHVGLFMVIGLFNGFVNIYFGAVMQRITAPEQMGRVFGLLNTMCGGLQPISQGLSGFMGDRVAVPLIYVVSSLLEGMGGTSFSRIPNLRGFLVNQEDTGIQSEGSLAVADN